MLQLLTLIACSTEPASFAPETQDTIVRLNASWCAETEFGALCDVPTADLEGRPIPDTECLIEDERVFCAVPGLDADHCLETAFGTYCEVGSPGDGFDHPSRQRWSQRDGFGPSQQFQRDPDVGPAEMPTANPSDGPGFGRERGPISGSPGDDLDDAPECPPVSGPACDDGDSAPEEDVGVQCTMTTVALICWSFPRSVPDPFADLGEQGDLRP